MRLTVLGCSPSFPNPGGACSGYLLETEETRLLMECGHGVCARLIEATDIEQLTAILITHMDPDHFFDLVPLKYEYRFAYHRDSPVPLLLPPHGSDVLRRLGEAFGTGPLLGEAFEVTEYDPQVSRPIGDLKVTFAPTRHYIEGYAVRAEHGAAPAFCFSSDTAFSESVQALARDAGLFLCEASLLRHPPDETVNGHMTSVEAATLARGASVDRLLLTHYPRALEKELLKVARGLFPGQVELAREGQSYEI